MRMLDGTLEKAVARRCPYICGPLTELPVELHDGVKAFYSSLADVCQEILGCPRGFVPHEHYDPVLHANFTPSEVRAAEFAQVSEGTNLLVVVAIQGSWGGGIEVGWAECYEVAGTLLCERQKLWNRKVSRLLRGAKCFDQGEEIAFQEGNFAHALYMFRQYLEELAAYQQGFLERVTER